ncbi:hypothetical protein MCOR07_011367 [Pyricularia oryzae]|nr:hypothetical protein MCOR01_003295 [Pyricularia oryzae]KAI6260106.1 hypothetical protein MCOR19_003523 [Pyricularia oryzae]KAI6287133.1 hypothetical protein MCOR26_000683 [Pyricularia oryzae]KAI6307885.1 hypothetical protein MCOR30_011612 [Pyricularia oryzae]KAI6326099.1 hypothetical protein MCOR34_000875 [Pyricularia oryzae]
MRPFGALLFEIIAVALLLLPSESPLATHYKALKDGEGIQVVDLAMDYSESGVAILSLLGKRQMSLTTIQAGFIRANFLKYCALVTEAWHAIGSVIRDAQEIGLHREALEPKPEAVTAGDAYAATAAVLRNQWHIQHRRRLWHVLFMWDTHAAAVLGRPTSVGEEIQLPLPVDCLMPRDRSSRPVQPRSADDPPTPLTRMLWALKAMVYLRQILKLEAKGTNPRNFACVDKLHQDLERLEDEIPPQFRLENPDISFDDHPDCRWLRAQRTLLPQMSAFNFIVLHRQYVFTRTQSRIEALKACLKMLGAQQIQFAAMKPEQYRAFSIFFGTFDAVILLATLYIVFPKEHLDLLPDALQHFRFAVERFSALSASNNLARAGVGVLRAIFHRLRKSLTLAGSWPSECIDQPWHKLTDAEVLSSLGGGMDTVPSTKGQQEGLAPHTAHIPRDLGVGAEDQSGPAIRALARDGEEWFLPENFDWSAVQPIAATSDLLYNDLMVGGGLDFGGIGGQDGWQQPQAWWPTDATGSETDVQPVGHGVGSGDDQHDANPPLQFEAFGEVFPGQLFEEVMDKEFMVTIDELAREALSKDLDSHKIEDERGITRLFQIMAMSLEKALLMDTTQWTVVTIANTVFEDYVLGDILEDTLDRLERQAMEIEGVDYDQQGHEAAAQNLRDRICRVCDAGLPTELLRDIHCKNDFIICMILEKLPSVINERLDLLAQTNYVCVSPKDMVMELMGNIREELSDEFGNDFSLLPQVGEQYRIATGIVLRSGKKLWTGVGQVRAVVWGDSP